MCMMSRYTLREGAVQEVSALMIRDRGRAARFVWRVLVRCWMEGMGSWDDRVRRWIYCAAEGEV